MLLVWLSCLVVVVGCGPRAKAITKINISCPGLSAVEGDAQVASPVMHAIAGLPAVKDCEGRSLAGRVEVYVTWDGASDGGALAKRVGNVTKLLPVQMDPAVAISDLPPPAVVPAAETGDEQVVVIKIDREKMEAFGLSMVAVADKAKSMAGPSGATPHGSLDEIGATVLSANGQEIHLRDVANIGLELHPKCIVRH